MAEYTLPARGGIHKTITTNDAADDRIDTVYAPATGPNIRRRVRISVEYAGAYVKAGGGGPVEASADGTYLVTPDAPLTEWVKRGEPLTITASSMSGCRYHVQIVP